MSDHLQGAVEALSAERTLSSSRLREAAILLQEQRLGQAAKLLQKFLNVHRDDPDAIYMLAEIAARQGEDGKAFDLLAYCVEIAPDFKAARFKYAYLLLKLNVPEQAFAEAEQLLERDPENLLFQRLKAIALEGVGDYAAASGVWRRLINTYPDEPDCWVRYGHALRVIGSEYESIGAYRKAAMLDPALGAAWWGLADMKTVRFGEQETSQIETQLMRTDLAAEDRIMLNFALGKAYGDLKLYEKSFGNYAKGNALQRVKLKHNPDVFSDYIAECKRILTKDFFQARSGFGCESRAPIFIVGMKRAGSTLLEQILASHSRVEGTRELSELVKLSRQIQTEVAPKHGVSYVEALEKLQINDLARLGERYLEGARVHRKLGKPFFTDKMGANFTFIGLLQLILPNAKIIDVRRHPLACGFSIFTQIFPSGENHAYRLADIGRSYRDYVSLMAHFDSVLPGKVYRVIYEDLIANPEANIRRLLDYLGLPFESECLRFHTTHRVVTTVSSQQVRQPIYQNALDHWRNYEPWLGPLIKSLCSVHTSYPDVPEDLLSGA